jgi:hypothetical protein
MTLDSYHERLRKQGDEIIDRTAKRMITNGYRNVTTNIAAFTYIFGRDDLKRLVNFAFDCVYLARQYKIRIKDFDKEVLAMIDATAHSILGKYNALSPSQHNKIVLNFPSVSELEKILQKEVEWNFISSIDDINT